MHKKRLSRDEAFVWEVGCVSSVYWLGALVGPAFTVILGTQEPLTVPIMLAAWLFVVLRSTCRLDLYVSEHDGVLVEATGIFGWRNYKVGEIRSFTAARSGASAILRIGVLPWGIRVPGPNCEGVIDFARALEAHRVPVKYSRFWQ